MTTVNQAGMGGYTGDSDVKRDKTKLAPQDFMTLMLAELKTQNPMKPYDNSAMLQNMAQISSLKATEDLQGSIKHMDSNMGKSQILSASQLVGRRANFPSEVSPLNDDTGLTGSVILPFQASAVTVTITDQNDKEVKTLHLGASSPGVVDFAWNGMAGEANETKMEPGFYKISATATINGQQTKTITAGTFKINSVALDPRSNEVILNVDGLGGMKMNEMLKIL